MTSIMVVDIETTSEAPDSGGVCEVGWSMVSDASGAWEVECSSSQLLDPGHPITAETRAVHHISDDDVCGKTPWRVGCMEVMAWALDCAAVAAHRADFERSWIGHMQNVPWICTYKCALHLWPDAPRHSNQVLRYWVDPEGLKHAEAMPPHRAGPDSYVTAFLLRDMLREGHSVADLVRWTKEPVLLKTCRFGKHRGKAWADVAVEDPGYLRWITGKTDFDEDVLHTARHHLGQAA